jgi:outer membrane protein TolC
MIFHPFRIFWLVVLSIMGGIAASAQEPLTLRQAVDRALVQNPEVAVAQADEKGASAAASLARTELLPKLNFTEDISRGNDQVYAFGTRLRQQKFTQADFALNALNRPHPIGNFSTRFSGSWVGFDSFKTQREIRRADLLRASTSSSAKAEDQQIVLRVIRAYQSVLYAQRKIEVAEHEQETAAALLTSVDERVKAGLAVESDRMSAQVNVAARKEELIAAQGDLELGWEDLRESMGDTNLKPSQLKPLEFHAFPEGSLEDEFVSAAKTRPDLAAIGQAQSAQTAAVGAAKSEFGPRVSAYGNWEEDRSSFAGSGGNNWLAGVQVSIDILPAGKRAQLSRETAAKRRIDAQLAFSQQHVRTEVNRAHIQRKTAQLSLETAQAAMAQASESLRILKNRYNAGLATITDLLRAEDAERQSQTSYWHAVYGNTLAYADLLYTTGTLTPETAEVLQ